MAYGPAHGASAVLSVGDGDDAAAAYQTNRRLDSSYAVGRRRADDGAVGFSADSGGADVRGNCGPRGGGGAAGIALERIGILREPAAAAPSTSGMAGTDVGPLAEIGLPQDNSSGGAQFLCDEGVLWRLGAGQSARTGGGHHAVGGIDVVLNKDGDPVHRSARAFGLALAIERVSNGENIRIELKHAVDRGTVFVDVVDALGIFFN